MNDRLNFSTHQKIMFMGLIFVVIFLELFDFSFLGAEKDVAMMTSSISRISAGLIFMILLYALQYKEIFQFKNTLKSLIIMIPALIIAINNFPIIAFFDGRATLTDPMYRIFLFLIECLSVGFFEEILFRGIILLVLIQKLEHRKNGTMYAILISSIFFGMLHLLNLFQGASISDVMLQVGYSFLVGVMWAVMYLRTHHLWLTMLMHALYNFFGQVMFYLGVVNQRYDLYTIIITVTLAILVSLYAIKLLKEISIKNQLKV